MPFDEKSARELEQWRTKYYDSLQQLEHKEREWRRTDNVLRQCISRLTLLADGTDRDLERQLERLREGIRGHMGGAQLEGMIQSLSQQLAKLDEQHRVQAVPPNPFDVLRQLADGISFPRGFGHKAKAYARNLSGQRPDADYSQPLRELVSLIGEALEWGASHEPEPEEAGGKGLLSKLFKRSEEAPSAAAVADVPAPIVQPPPAARAEHHDLDLAKGIIGQLVSGVVGPSGSQLGKVAGRLPAIQREDELRRLVDELAVLMSLPAVELRRGRRARPGARDAGRRPRSPRGRAPRGGDATPPGQGARGDREPRAVLPHPEAGHRRGRRGGGPHAPAGSHPTRPRRRRAAASRCRRAGGSARPRLPAPATP